MREDMSKIIVERPNYDITKYRNYYPFERVDGHRILTVDTKRQLSKKELKDKGLRNDIE